jgi:PhoH-like ATPase
MLSDIKSLESFGDNDVVIPLAVLEELDHNKKRMDEVGSNARAISRSLDSLREKGSLHDWVPLDNGGRLKVMQNGQSIKELLPPELLQDKNDNLVIGLALSIKKHQGINPIVVSKDINVRVKCDALGLQAQDYLKQRAADLAEHLYTGVAVRDLDDDRLASIWSTSRISAVDVMPEAFPNQIVVIPKNDKVEHSTVVRRVKEQFCLVKQHRSVFGLMPRNKEQNFALDLLLDDSVKLVTLVGAAGCGKTLIALAAGLQLTIGNNPKYSKLVVSRPIEPLGRDLGYLPGTMEEKMTPWIAPIRDNLDFLLSVKKDAKGNTDKNPKNTFSNSKENPYMDLLFEEGKLEIEAVTYIRGRSIPNAYILIDEAQNLTVHQLKTIITRSGENSKIVLAGDLQQIDVSHMDAVSNGLSYVVEAFKNEDIAGHVTLLKGERSELATLASELL